MLLYLTSNQKSGLIDGAAHEMLMPSKKLVGKFSLKSFVTKDMRNYATAKFFLIDAASRSSSAASSSVSAVIRFTTPMDKSRWIQPLISSQPDRITMIRAENII